MKPGQQGQTGKASRKDRRRGTGPASLAGHSAFAPLLGLWGALLGGLVVLVLPFATVERLFGGTLLGTWGPNAQLLLALSTALLLGGSLLGLGLHHHRRARRRDAAPSLARAAMRGVTPINPARDLGTRSLDDPFETMPFATPAWRDADLEEPRQKSKPAGLTDTAPQELDLAAFAQLPGRNAVWVEEVPAVAPVAAPKPAPEPAQAPAPAAGTEPEAEIAPTAPAEPARPAAAPRLRAVTPPPAKPLPPLPGTAALSRLRAVPPGDLSLAEMVERFAGALHEHRNTPRASGLDQADLAARETALAEALRALAALSRTVASPADSAPQDEPLRAALTQLQPRRGAA